MNHHTFIRTCTCTSLFTALVYSQVHQHSQDHQEGRVETFGEDRIELLDSLRSPPGLPRRLPPGRFVPGPRPAAPVGNGLTAPEASEVPSPALGALGARGARVFRPLSKAPLAITVEIVEDDEAEVAEMAELLSNRVLRF